ncbi:putative uncharacterized protein B3GALT5-AS1 [Callithrix jacchus]
MQASLPREKDLQRPRHLFPTCLPPPHKALQSLVPVTNQTSGCTTAPKPRPPPSTRGMLEQYLSGGGQKSHRLCWLLCFVSQGQNQGVIGAELWGRIHIQTHWGCWQNPAVWICGKEVLVSLLAVGQGLPSASGGHLPSLAHGPSHPDSQHPWKEPLLHCDSLPPLPLSMACLPLSVIFKSACEYIRPT